jgi:hypothetical protein
MNVYKIYNKETGKYSDGASDAAMNTFRHWSTRGKVWQGLGPLRVHLNHVIRNGGIPDSWEVVTFDVTEASRKPVIDLIKPEKLIELLSQQRKRN